MTWVMKLYRLALRLYPQSFRDRFAHEMEEVFRAGLEEALEQDTLAGYLLREALRLPGSLMDVYAWALRAGEGPQLAISSTGGGATVRTPIRGEGWGASLLAGLPNLVMGIIIVSSAVIGELKGADQIAFRVLQIVITSVLLLGVLLFSISRGWRLWSASWLTYLFLLAVILLSLAANSLASNITGIDDWVPGVQMMAIPLLLAYLLYKIACSDRLRGLLAAVPPMALIWAYFEELVPALPRALAWGWIFVLAFGASVMMLRTRRFTAALGLAMAVPVLGGLPFVYLGVYEGGTLPFTEPGPSLLEVWRQYLPFLAAVLSVGLGPQLAAKLRAIGRESAGSAGRIFYRIVLAGMLLGLAFTLLQLVIVTGGIARGMYILPAVRPVWLIAAAVLYLAGFVSLLWAATFASALSGDHLAVLRLAALFILLPGVPLAIFLAIPNFALSGSYSWLLPAAENAWALAAALLIMEHKPG